MNQTVIVWIQPYVFLTHDWLVFCFLNKYFHDDYFIEAKQKAEIIGESVSLPTSIQRTVC